jgi:hypothetical protein
MTDKEFVFWLRGFSEAVTTVPTFYQWESVTRALTSVFKKETPKRILYPHQVGFLPSGHPQGFIKNGVEEPIYPTGIANVIQTC